MPQPADQPERIADAPARHLLERAASLDADGLTLDQLRDAATEAGISSAAFDAAVAEWRAAPRAQWATQRRRRLTDGFIRNAIALAGGWAAMAVLALPQVLFATPWVLHKLTDPLGLAVGALIAVRLRARTATVVLGGIAVSQGAEFLMDLASGAPAIHGAGAHFALMIAGIAGVALGARFVRQSPDQRDAQPIGREAATTPSDERFSDMPLQLAVEV